MLNVFLTVLGRQSSLDELLVPHLLLLCCAHRSSAQRSESCGWGAAPAAPPWPPTAHLFVRHPHPQAVEAHDGVEGGLHVGEGPLQRRPQPGQVAGGEAVAGGQGPGTGEEE